MQAAITRHGLPERFNTDQSCQLTSQAFTGLLKSYRIQIGRDGTGSWRDNDNVVFAERLWRSLKYEAVYLHAYEPVRDALSTQPKPPLYATMTGRIKVC